MNSLLYFKIQISSFQSLSCEQFHALCDPTNCRTSGLPVHHQLLELAQKQVQRKVSQKVYLFTIEV